MAVNVKVALLVLVILQLEGGLSLRMIRRRIASKIIIQVMLKGSYFEGTRTGFTSDSFFMDARSFEKEDVTTVSSDGGAAFGALLKVGNAAFFYMHMDEPKNVEGKWYRRIIAHAILAPNPTGPPLPGVFSETKITRRFLYQILFLI